MRTLYPVILFKTDARGRTWAHMLPSSCSGWYGNSLRAIEGLLEGPPAPAPSRRALAQFSFRGMEAEDVVSLLEYEDTRSFKSCKSSASAHAPRLSRDADPAL